MTHESDREAACWRDELAPRPRPRWTSLPVLVAPNAILRDLHPGDAPTLLAMLGNDDVQRFLPLGPTTEKGFLTLVRWARRERRIGRHLCFGVVPHGFHAAVGVFQIWPLEASFQTAEWGFALGKPFWGSGLFAECAQQIVDFAINQLGVRRLEARAAVDNVRGNGALQKLGAVREGVLRQCFECGGQAQDHVMWAILSDDWHRFRERPLSRTSGRSSEESLVSCI